MKEQRRQERVARRLGAAGVGSEKATPGLTGRAKKERMRELARERRAEAEAESSATSPFRTTSVAHWAKPAVTHVEVKKKKENEKKEEQKEEEEQPKPVVVDLMID